MTISIGDCRALADALEGLEVRIERVAANRPRAARGDAAKGQNPKGGLNAEGRRMAAREGHHLKPPVSAKEAKTSPRAAARRRSFCARMSGEKGPMEKNGEPTRKALALRKWDCPGA